MIKKLFFLPVLLLGAVTFFAPACNDDPCKGVECGTNGVCNSGVCDCADGYEGTACDVEWAAKFIGSYLGNDVCSSGTYNLTKPAVITKKNDTVISISNFGGFDSFLEATISRGSGSDSATQLSLNFTDPAGRVFNGSASLSGNVLSGSYTVTFTDGDSDSCTFTYSK